MMHTHLREAMLDLQGENSVSSNAGPAPAGGTAIGILENGCAGSGSDDEKSLVHAQGLAESAQSTGHANPQSSGWTK
jgi:hypothetical protein